MPQNNPQKKSRGGVSEDRGAKDVAKGLGHNVRASISKEVTTASANPSVQPR